MARRKGVLAGGIILVVVGGIMLPIGIAGYTAVVVRDEESPCGVPDAGGSGRGCTQAWLQWLGIGIAGAGILAGGIVLIAKSNKRAEPIRSP